MHNKQGIEENLLQIEKLCPEVLEMFHIIYKISYLFLDTVSEILPEYKINVDYSKLPIKDSINLVREFLISIDKKYLEIFDKSLNDGTFEFFYEEDDLVERPNYPVATPVPNASIYIPVTNTIQDGAIIIHEFFHYLNDSEEFVAIRDIFTEMISIYFELRYYDFLVSNGYNRAGLYQEMYERIDNTFDSANTLCYSSSALDIYDNTGNIDRKNIKFISRIRRLYKSDVREIIDFYNDDEFIDIIDEFVEDLSYVIGTLLAFFSLKEPTIYDVKLKYINDNINNLTIKDVLNVLDTKITDYPIWIEECINGLKKALGEIYEEDNMYSRTYRSR